MLWIIRDSNLDAIAFYLEIINKTCKENNIKVKIVDSINEVSGDKKKDIFLVTTPLDALKVLLQGNRRFVFWFQGLFSEESFMRNRSKLRRKVLRGIEKYFLKKSELLIFVSYEMRKYYELEFNLNLEEKSYVMPCFNAMLQEKSFNYTNKYKNNIFCYAGSLSVWQGFDVILDCYKKIEEKEIYNTQLMVLTNEVEKAKKLLSERKIRNFSVNYVPPNELPQTLARAKFGFIIRDDNHVNRVATPTKISTYMSNGLIPIYSECIKDFSNEVKDYQYVVNYDSKEFEQKIHMLMETSIESGSVAKEYRNIFREYFNTSYHS